MTEESEPVERNQSQKSKLIKQLAYEVGFDLAGIAPAVTPEGYHQFLDWLDQGYAGEMGYLERRKEAYQHPRHVMSSVRSVLMLALNYRTSDPPTLSGTQARVSRYAWGGSDYHNVIRKKMKLLSQRIREEFPDCETRGVVDTAPLLERDYAQLAGLGWIGKNTLLLSKTEGSWFFLAGMLLSDELECDEPTQTSHCGTCTRCLDACPTDAFVEAGTLDARKCISYLTIELRDQPVPTELRTGMQEWVFGCDVCQDICPWNSKAPVSRESIFQPEENFTPIDAAELLSLDDMEFQKRFHGTPMSRPRRAGLLRNAAIVLGNLGDDSAVSILLQSLKDSEPLVRGAAAWALGERGSKAILINLEEQLTVELETDVINELRQSINEIKNRSE